MPWLDPWFDPENIGPVVRVKLFPEISDKVSTRPNAARVVLPVFSTVIV